MKNVDIPKWLERLPLAPEFRPTDTEFADPIAYISKIEKEASVYGICKVIPPLPKPSRKYVLQNLNKSLSKCPELGSDVNLVTSSKSDSPRNNCDGSVNGGESRAVFTTRHQELGCEKGKKVKTAVRSHVLGAQKQVWQSGEVYTLEQFEAKSKNFAKSQLGTVKEVNPLVIEAMFWKAASDKPVYIEYANDVPGSGFGEPDGLFHYFHRSRRRRRRKRNSYDRNNLDSSDNKNDQVDNANSIRADKNSDSQNNVNLCTETASNSLPSAESHLGASFSKDSRPSSEMEGTAGWKLSNCPWNLQVIARSPGSLTRFMPDDIPGVTSPMVYIGMLFSWFAWHVEDHELHSLNFLHMGSPKTWYSVPGDYAFNFEEVIRLHAYGGNTDRLVALSLLGEKTTVLSPEVIVASGIPCCRLVQNPGEFVVTFPRAYHIGFSHGFNCGEAANFGTPKWLTVAKEAAVRRAAMNYLPMLSHQQLLYLLTMSFISRIPRSLLPGVRSSRLRDRQKEEREILVKRAFIEDILHENNLLTILLQRNSSYHAVLWDMESLPSSNKESEISKDVDAAIRKSTEKDRPENDDSMDNESQLSKYISAVGFDLNDDDLAYDFQMDSGTLPCVACGILGFPFMAVVQPSEAASKNLVVEDHLTFPVQSCVVADLDHVAEGSAEDAENKDKLNGKGICRLNEASSVAESSRSTLSPAMEQLPVSDHSSPFKYEIVSSKVEIGKEWNISNVFLKPRIFCLEHAIEIEELLCSKGGSNVLLICHSDFQKIKAHAAVVAEEIATRFNYNEIPLSIASQEDLNLIDIAIDSEKQVDFTEDWTSQLNINLQHCVKVKRIYPSKNLQYLLNLDGLFCGVTPVSNSSGVKWVSRKLRSKRHLKYPLQGKVSDGVETVKKALKTNLEREMAKKDVKIIQYSRKRYKSCNSKARVENGELQTGNFSSNEPIAEGKTGISCHDSQGKGCIEKNESNISENHSDSPPSDENRRENEILTEERAKSSSIEEHEHIQTEGDYHDKAVSNDTPSINESISALVEQLHVPSDTFEKVDKRSHNDNDETAPAPNKQELDGPESTMEKPESITKTENKRKRDESHFDGFIKSPCEGLRPRARKDASGPNEETLTLNKPIKPSALQVTRTNKKQKQRQKGLYKCDLDGCTMSFHTKGELVLHKGNRCPVDGCRKKFNSHKYAIQHQRVHDDDRPLKCPWDGCTMSFKWAWARTEHLRVHTGERPYMCKVEECGLTFRFVSDFSRHRRKTGHYVNRSK